MTQLPINHIEDCKDLEEYQDRTQLYQDISSMIALVKILSASDIQQKCSSVPAYLYFYLNMENEKLILLVSFKWQYFCNQDLMGYLDM